MEIYDGVAASGQDPNANALDWPDREVMIERMGLSPAEPEAWDGDAVDPWRQGTGADPTGPDGDDGDIPVRPRPEEDPDDHTDDDQDPEDASGGACFVATAAYGDPMHPDVVALRNFRDRHLVRFRAGRAFIRFYWVVGPLLASVTRPERLHGRIARGLLSKFVTIIRRVGSG